MALLRKCDRCHRAEEAKAEIILGPMCARAMPDGWLYIVAMQKGQGHFDLCADCSTKWERFMVEGLPS